MLPHLAFIFRSKWGPSRQAIQYSCLNVQVIYKAVSTLYPLRLTYNHRTVHLLNLFVLILVVIYPL